MALLMSAGFGSGNAIHQYHGTGVYELKVTDDGGKTLESRKGGQVFDDAIRDLSNIRAKRALEPKQGARELANYAGRVAEFAVRDNTKMEVISYRAVVVDGPPWSVMLFAFDRYFYDTLLSVELFEKLAIGCSALSRDQ